MVDADLFEDITCVDFSPAVIEHMKAKCVFASVHLSNSIDQMQKDLIISLFTHTHTHIHLTHRYAPKQQIRYVLADATNMKETASNGSFDVVVDKGTFDALICHPEPVQMVYR